MMTHPWRAIEGGITAPAGFQHLIGITAGLKASGRSDLALVLAPAGAVCGGSFTTNCVRAACRSLCGAIEASGGNAQDLINSGQANACTGDLGLIDSQRATQAVADQLGLSQEEVLICSTGVIGVPIPMDTLLAWSGAFGVGLWAHRCRQLLLLRTRSSPPI